LLTLVYITDVYVMMAGCAGLQARKLMTGCNLGSSAAVHLQLDQQAAVRL
jgi:hypothetical protein